MIDRVCTGKGSGEYRAEGSLIPFNTIGLDEIWAMAANPVSFPKNDAPWIIPSSYHLADARDFSVQRNKGEYKLLCWDIDKGNHDLATVISVTEQVVGKETAFVVYSSSSSRDDQKKWRVLIIIEPQPPLNGFGYTAFQTVFFDRMVELGIRPDYALARSAQLVYLPNKGEFYQYHYNPGAPLNLSQHPLAHLAAQAHKEAVAASQVQRGDKHFGHHSYLGAFRRKHDVVSLLHAYGFQTKNEINWLNPYSGSGSHGGFKLFEDGGWFASSDGMIQHHVGKAAQGGRAGDGFDLYVHFTCQDNFNLAIEYAKKCLAEELANDPFVIHGRELFENLFVSGQPAGHKAVEAAAEEHAKRNQEALEEFHKTVDKGFTKFTVLGPLTGFTERLATWIDKHFMFYDQPEIAKVAALTAVAGFVGRKDSFNDAAPVFNCLGLGITGIGKDIVDGFLNVLIDDLSSKYDEFKHKELHVFKPMTMNEGVRSYNREMSRRLSTVIILPESGMNKNSKAGDREKVQSYIMTNIAGSAYRQLRFSQQSIGLLDVYGVPHSVFEESTFEAYRDHLNNNAHATGEAARRLFYRFDVSRGNTSGRVRSSELPDWILDGFYRLAMEGLRGEDEAMRTTIDDQPAPGSVRGNYAERIRYQSTKEVEDAFLRMEQETLEARRSNKENVADITWGHKSGRQILLHRQLALLLARTDCVVDGTAAVVEMRHLEAAGRLILASQATELANSESFGNPLDELAKTVLETMAKFFSKEPNTTYRKNWGVGRNPDICFAQHWFPWAMVTTNPNLSRKADSMVNGAYNKKRVWEDLQKHGSDLGYWQIEIDNRKAFVIPNLDRL